MKNGCSTTSYIGNEPSCLNCGLGKEKSPILPIGRSTATSHGSNCLLWRYRENRRAIQQDIKAHELGQDDLAQRIAIKNAFWRTLVSILDNQCSPVGSDFLRYRVVDGTKNITEPIDSRT